MSDIVAFLNARLDEDEALAREASAFYDDDQINGVSWNGHEGEDLNGQMRYWIAPHLGVVNDVASGRHIARHDPARVLREVKVKREVLTWHEVVKAKVEDRGEMRDGVKPTDLIASAELGVLKVIVRDLAAVYAEHPDYEQAWSVE